MPAKKPKKNSRLRSHAWLIIRSALLGFFGIIIFIILAGVGVTIYYTSTLPDYRSLAQISAPESSKIYSRDGTLLYEFHGEVKRTTVSLDKISTNLQHATVAVEDKDFYKHGAISSFGIIRAALANYRNKTVTQGGSTITQQYVKNALLSGNKSFGRKLAEVIESYRIESHLNKEQILELYLNEIPYGRNAYGAEAAAQAYFGKSARDLDLAQSAYLAALPQAPSYLSPTGDHPDALEARKNIVLDDMLEQGYISKLQHDDAAGEKVAFITVHTSIIAPYFVSWIQNILTDQYGDQFLREGGLKVYTTLDLRLQALAEQVVKQGAADNARKNNASNAALVAVEPSSGKVLAMVGGKDYFGEPEPAGCRPGVNCRFDPNVNVATQPRQPGSSFKPYAYVTAFGPQFGYSPASKILDSPTSFGTANGVPYVPRDYDGGSRGWVTIRKALAGSLNIPAVRIVNAVGVGNVTATARALGITSPLSNCGLSLVLGGCEIKLVDHVGAFAALSNGGEYEGTTPFLRIEDKNGKVLEQYTPLHNQAADPAAVAELISIMTDDKSRQYIFGAKNPLNLPDRPVACKTGTTQNWKDGWTICFTPQLAAGVWVGNNDGTLMRAGADGVFTAAPIWQKFMTLALAGQPVLSWPVPDSVVQIKVDPISHRPLTNPKAKGVLDPFAWYALPADFKVAAAPSSAVTKIGGPDTVGKVEVPLVSGDSTPANASP